MNKYAAEPADATQTLTRLKNLSADENGIVDQPRPDIQISAGGLPSELAGPNFKSLIVGLIDRYRLTQECLSKALGNLHPEIKISTFTAVQDCIDAAPHNFDLIIYHLHGNDAPDTTMTQTIATITQVFPTTPVMIFSDAGRTQHQTIMRSALESGARGFVPTQTAGLPITSAAISLVSAGGTFVPADLMLTAPRNHSPGRLNRLTSRQSAVFTRLQLGKTNKIIAYELGMCESTVKVHVRNIMRKVGATNRTQAAYKGQRFSNNSEAQE
ncbi:response regulator transcription factor [Acidisphaera sp. S103]|uniref:helix-turn-helix transcriptional regulator n=1 Tax=Acidisphaera sp. S103 TaxID=1747223 RepID=UPI00131AEE56|nr:response regulator transcription factor [Acidisphaera sp. S103]